MAATATAAQVTSTRPATLRIFFRSIRNSIGDSDSDFRNQPGKGEENRSIKESRVPDESVQIERPQNASNEQAHCKGQQEHDQHAGNEDPIDDGFSDHAATASGT